MDRDWQRSKSTLHTTPWQCRRLCQATCRQLQPVQSRLPHRRAQCRFMKTYSNQRRENRRRCRRNDDAEEQVRSVKQTGSRVRADGWISELTASPQATLLPTPPSRLREIAPAVNIQPFGGDPLQWDMFISMKMKRFITGPSFFAIKHGFLFPLNNDNDRHR
ncbi:hypothetical protein M513_11470 [Trichuris suis]|uniref:Uncharacterized protein n=1 Tax=Trichuris suis TaxID=68888 RepID=A0A085LRT3_9BILA|nr:hypothetical protein M513_11470 [Trichuris suis]